MAQRVIAKVTGKGFKLDPKGTIHHNSSVVFLDRESYLDNENDKIQLEILSYFASAITRTLKNKRVKPGSLRITFQLLEE